MTKRSVAYHTTKWQLKDRLTERDLVRLIMASQTGMTAKALAQRYGINVKSVRKVVRQHEANLNVPHVGL